jgi:hypothetical protein
MGFLDRFKKKAADAAEEHEDKIDDAIDKAADFADEKTGGKHTDKISPTTTTDPITVTSPPVDRVNHPSHQNLRFRFRVR